MEKIKGDIFKYTYNWLEKYNISYNDITNKEYMTRIYLMKNGFKFSSSLNISHNYRYSYYVKIEELIEYYPWIQTMMSFLNNEYSKHYHNVSYTL